MKKFLVFTMVMLAFTCFTNAQTVYNFNDGSWGDVVTERPVSGSYESQTINDVKFTNAMLFQKDGKGQKRVILDKSSLKSAVEFPAFSEEKKEVIIEAGVGTEDKSMIVEEKVNGKWKQAKEVDLTKSKETYKIKISDKATQIRILNASSSSLYLYTVTIK